MFADVDIANSIEQFFDELFTFIPELIAGILILVAGYFVAKLVARAVGSALQGAGLDRTLTSGQSGAFVQNSLRGRRGFSARSLSGRCSSVRSRLPCRFSASRL